MADVYANVKRKKLKLKGSKSKKHKKHKKSKSGDGNDSTDQPVNEDTLRHGGWWRATTFSDIRGRISIEISNMRYLHSKDNGLFILGKSQEIGQCPDPEEIFTAMPLSETKIALKSGYDKYLGVGTDGLVVGRADAVGSREQWEPVFQDEQLALLGCNNCFLSIADTGDAVCASKKADEDEMITIRSSYKEENKKDDRPIEMRSSSSKETEEHYVKMFQSFQDRKIRINPEDRSNIKRARTDGNLHEELLNRREKMKADRYCK